MATNRIAPPPPPGFTIQDDFDPPPPPGFTIQEDEPPPPPGFTVQAAAEEPPPPPGFAIQGEPEDTGVLTSLRPPTMLDLLQQSIGNYGQKTGLLPGGGEFRGAGAGGNAEDQLFRGHGMSMDYSAMPSAEFKATVEHGKTALAAGKEAARGLALGTLVDTPDMYLRAARTIGLDEKLGIDTANLLNKISKVDAALSPEDKEKFKVLRESFRTVPQSVAGGLPGMMLGSLGGNPVTAVGGFALSGGTLFGLAEYDRFLEEAEKLGIPRAQARNPAILSAAAEGGFEALSDVGLGKLLGLSKPVKAGALTPLRTHLMNLAKSIPVETLSELGTASVQDVARKQAGLSHVGPWEAAKQALPVALGGSILLGGLGAGYQAYRERAAPAPDLVTEKEQELLDALVGKNDAAIEAEDQGPLPPVVPLPKDLVGERQMDEERRKAVRPPAGLEFSDGLTVDDYLGWTDDKGKPRIPTEFKNAEEAQEWGREAKLNGVWGIPREAILPALGRRLDNLRALKGEEYAAQSAQVEFAKEAIEAYNKAPEPLTSQDIEANPLLVKEKVDDYVRQATSVPHEVSPQPGQIPDAGTGKPGGSGTTILGKRVRDDFAKRGWTDHRGKRVAGPSDVAILAQVHRDPNFETFRWLFVDDDGTILASDGATSRLPGLTEIHGKSHRWAEGRVLFDVRRRMERLGATGYFLVHNHPSGKPTASTEDMQVSERISKTIPGFRGHVILNHQRFGLIERNVTPSLYNPSSMVDRGIFKLKTGSQAYGGLLPSAKDPALKKPDVANDWLGTTIDSPDAVASVAQSIYKDASAKHPDKNGLIVWFDNRHEVRGIVDVPLRLVGKAKEFNNWFVGQSRSMGSSNAVLYMRKDRAKGADAAVSMDQLELYVFNGVFRDVILEHRNKWESYPPRVTSFVTEGIAVNYPGHYLGISTKRKTPGAFSEQQAEERKTKRLPAFRAREAAPGWYSQLEEVAERKLPGKMTGLQAKGLIQAMQKKGEVKQEEIEDSGILEWLEKKAGEKISKQEVIQFVHENAPEILESNLAALSEKEQGRLEELEAKRLMRQVYDEGGRWNLYDREGKPMLFDTLDEADKYVDLYGEEGGFKKDNIFVQYQERDKLRGFLDTGSGIRITDPFMDPTGRFAVQDPFEYYKGRAPREEIERVVEHVRNAPPYLTPEEEAEFMALRDPGESRKPKFQGYRPIKGGENYLEKLLRLPEGKGPVDKHKTEGWRGSHWEQPNVFAHYRASDRVGPKGEKVLLVEEIQSDLHQIGKKSGYVKPKDMDAAFPGAWAGAPPDFPFKKSWQMVTIKRAIRQAIDGGYDSIAWATGEAHAAMYDQLMQVRKIRWYNPQKNRHLKNPVGVREVDIELIDGRTVGMVVGEDGRVLDATSSPFIDHGLDEVIGKEHADKIMAKDVGTLSGEGLKIGGEKLKNFYNRELVNDVNRYVKKWGGKVKKGTVGVSARNPFYRSPASVAEVETLEAENGTHSYYVTAGNVEGPQELVQNLDEAGDLFQSGYKTKLEAEAAGVRALQDLINRLSDEFERTHGDEHTAPAWVLDITQQMRDSISMLGQPMYQTGPHKVGKSPALLKEDLKRIVPRSRIQEVRPGYFELLMPNGMVLFIDKKGTITVDEKMLEALAKSRGAATAEEVRLGTKKIAGAFHKISELAGVIELSKYERSETLDHELFHAAMAMVLTPQEIKTILDTFGSEEAAADAYSVWNPAMEHNGLFDKIMKFFRRWLRTIMPKLYPANAAEIFEMVERGDVWTRETKKADGSKPATGQRPSSIGGVRVRTPARLAPLDDLKARVPKDSAWSQAKNLQLVNVDAEITERHKATPRITTFTVSVDPRALSQEPDRPTRITLKTLKQARSWNASAERVKDWIKIYAAAYKRNPINTFKQARKEGEEFKIRGVRVVDLTRGCQRARATVERVRNGLLPALTRIEACFGGMCWVNIHRHAASRTHKNMEIRDLAVTNPAKIAAWFDDPENIAWMKDSKIKFIRMGQRGDSSHDIATGAALEWLKGMKKAKVGRKTVFISSGYAPITDAQYQALAPYSDLFEIHFSVSGWFDRNELMLRLAEFQAAKDAGLQPVLRFITNADKVGGLEFLNEDWLIKQMKKMGVSQQEVLETPYHDDWKKQRSKPSGKFKNICCETGQCKTCGAVCMTGKKLGSPAETNYQLVGEPTAQLAQPAHPVIKGKTGLVFMPQRGSIKRATPSELLPAKGPGDTKATRKEITNKIMEAFGIPIFFGRVPSKAAGKFMARAGIARVRAPLDIEGTLLTVSPKVFAGMKMGLNEHAAELEALAPKDAKNPVQEGAGIFFQRYVTGVQGKLVEEAPEFYNAFEEILSFHPEMQSAIVAIRQLWINHKLTPPQKRLSDMIVSGDRKKPRMTINQFMSNFVDDIHHLETMTKEVEKRTGEKLAPQNDVYKVAWLTRGWPKRAIQFLRWGTFRMTPEEGYQAQGPGLFQVLKDVEASGRRHELDQYLVAKRVVNDERLLKSYDGIMSAEEFAEIVKQLEPEFGELAKKLHQYNADLLQYLEDSGRISHKLVEKIQKKNLFYVPLYRVMDAPVNQGGLSNKKFGDLFDPLKRVGGEARELYSPTETMVANTFTIVNIASRNQVGRALAKVAAMPGMGDLIHKIDTPQTPIKMQLKEAIKSIQASLEDTTSATAANIYSMLDNMLAHNKEVKKLFSEMAVLEAKGEMDLATWETMVEAAGLAPEDLFLVQEVLTAFRPNYRTGPNEAVFYEDGKPTIYWIHPDVYKAVMALDSEDVNAAWRLFSFPAKWLRAGATIYSPEFALRNPVRDQITAFLFSKYGYKPFFDLARGTFHIFKKTELFQQYNASGAGSAAIVSMDRNYIQKDLSKLLAGYMAKMKHAVRHPLESVQMISELLEEGTRMGAFARAARGGVFWGKKDGPIDLDTLFRAGLEARDMTLDFQRFGNLTKGWSMVTAFWNPKTQGLDKMRRAFRDAPGRTSLLAFLGITVPSLLIWAAQKDDPYYQEIPPWKRILFWNFVTHNDDGTLKNIWSIPKPFEMGLLFGSIPEIIGDWIVEKDKGAAKELMKAIWEGASPLAMPNIMIAPIEWEMEQSLFMDRPIVSRGNENVAPYLQYNAYTSRSIRLLAEVMNKVPGLRELASPEKLENLLYTTTAGAGRLLVGSMDKALEKMNVGDIPKMPKQNVNDAIPGWKGFHMRFPSASSRSVERFYDMYEKESEAYASQMKEQGLSGKSTLLKGKAGGRKITKIRDATKSPFLKRLEAYKEMMDFQRTLAATVFEDRQATPLEKRQSLDAIWWTIINLSRDAIGKKALPDEPKIKPAAPRAASPDPTRNLLGTGR